MNPHEMNIPDDAPAVWPLRDTWEWKQDNARWTLETGHVLLPLATAEHNHWWADALAGALACCQELLRPRAASIADGRSPAAEFRWAPGASAWAFRDALVEAVRSDERKVIETSMEVDLRSWFRMAESEGRAVPGWLTQNGNELLLAGGDSDEGVYISLKISNTLFSPRSVENADNRELWALNQPRLEGALRALQARFGGEYRVEGESLWNYEYGFLPDSGD